MNTSESIENSDLSVNPDLPVKKSEISGDELFSKNKKSRNFLITQNFKEISEPKLELEPKFDSFKTKPSFAIWKWEKGKKGTLHWHMYIEFPNAIRWTTVKSKFMQADIRIRKGTQKQAITYVTKEDTKVSEPKTYGTFEEDKQGNRTDLDQLKVDIYENGFDVEMVKMKYFGLYLRYHSAIDKMIYTRRYEPTTRTADDFVVPLLQDLSLPILLYGQSGTGKTSYALAHFKKPLLVKRIEDLRSLSKIHDGIVFDDMSFRDWTPEQIIHLLDIETNSSIHARFNDVVIPAGTKRIFTHNSNGIFFPKDLYEEHYDAIGRRFQEVEVTRDLRKIQETQPLKRPKIVL